MLPGRYVRVRWQRDARCHEAVQHRGLSGIEAVEPGGTGPGTRLSDVRMNGLEDFRNTKVGEGASEAGAFQFGGREVVGGAAGIARCSVSYIISNTTILIYMICNIYNHEFPFMCVYMIYLPIQVGPPISGDSCCKKNKHITL